MSNETDNRAGRRPYRARRGSAESTFTPPVEPGPEHHTSIKFGMSTTYIRACTLSHAGKRWIKGVRTACQIASGAQHWNLGSLACDACIALHVSQVHQRRVRAEELRNGAYVEYAVTRQVCLHKHTWRKKKKKKTLKRDEPSDVMETFLESSCSDISSSSDRRPQSTRMLTYEDARFEGRKIMYLQDLDP